MEINFKSSIFRMIVLLTGVVIFYHCSNGLESQIYSGEWELLSQRDQARYGLGFQEVNGKFYALGGTTRFVETFEGTWDEVYDPETNEWVVLDSKPNLGRHFGATGVIDNRIYLAGGTLKNGNSTIKTEVFNPLDHTWTNTIDMPLGRGSGARGIVYNSKLYVAGGVEKEGKTNRLLKTFICLDPEKKIWTDFASMHEGRDYPGFIEYKGYFYIFGGNECSGIPLTSVEVYNISENRWEISKIKLPFSLCRFSCSRIGKLVYFVGGANSSGNSVKSVYIYDLKDGTWHKGPDLPFEVSFGASLVFDNKIYHAGGRKMVNNHLSAGFTISKFISLTVDKNLIF